MVGSRLEVGRERGSEVSRSGCLDLVSGAGGRRS
jgi:hypothetical protein